MNPAEKTKFISNWIKDYVEQMPSKAESLVIGISGGIDSSVSSTLSAMTGLRTIWGVSLKKIEIEFGIVFQSRLLQNADKYLKTNFLKIENLHLKATNRGKFLVDGIASDLFIF